MFQTIFYLIFNISSRKSSARSHRCHMRQDNHCHYRYSSAYALKRQWRTKYRLRKKTERFHWLNTRRKNCCCYVCLSTSRTISIAITYVKLINNGNLAIVQFGHFHPTPSAYSKILPDYKQFVKYASESINTIMRQTYFNTVINIVPPRFISDDFK